jgi:phospholipase C
MGECGLTNLFGDSDAPYVKPRLSAGQNGHTSQFGVYEEPAIQHAMSSASTISTKATHERMRHTAKGDSMGRKGNGEPRAAAPTATLSRRRFLKHAVAGAALAVGGATHAARQETHGSQKVLLPLIRRAATLPPPQHSGIDHVVVVMMENRSFDHFLGWYSDADGKQAGLTYLDTSGTPHETYPLAPDYQGCGHPDPDHSYGGGRIEYNNGACDGWLRAGTNDRYAIGYYTAADLAFLGDAAPTWTTCARYFSAIMGPTYPNRLYQHAAQTDRLTNSIRLSSLPTIWDRLAARGLTRRYYYSDIPFLSLWGVKYLTIGRSFNAFLNDCSAGTLPHVAFVEPRFLGAENGTSNDDHPYADIRNGQAFLYRVYKAVTTSPAWSSTLLCINYDEWGGFFDHLPPPSAPIPSADQAAGNTDGLCGFRVPCLLIGPWARRGFVPDTVYDHTSILKLIEWRWGLDPLTVRDATANNIAEALDFEQPNFVAPDFSVPLGPFGGPCPAAHTVEDHEWEDLRITAQQYGWPVYRQ